MLWRRIFYALIVIASFTAFILTDSAAALFVGIAVVVAPLLSFAMLVIASKRVRFEISMRESCIRGNALQITMKAELKPRFLVGSLRVNLELINTTFNKTLVKKFRFTDLSFSPRVFDFVSSDSGRIIARYNKLVLTDIFGIYSLGVRHFDYREATVAPVLYENTRFTLSASSNSSYSGENVLPVKGSDHTEIFNIRDYAAGDSLNSVHWKLSGKFDSLKSKEYGSTDDNRVFVLVDMSRIKGDNVADDEALNAVLDVAVSVSNSLKTRGVYHKVGWFNDGELSSADVFDSNSFVQMVTNLMSVKVDEGNSEDMFYLSRAVERPTFTKVIFISTSVRHDELKQFSGADITALSVGNSAGEWSDGNVKIVRVPRGEIEKSLASYVF